MAQNDIATNLADNNTNWINVKNAIENKGVSTQNKVTSQYPGLIAQIKGNLNTLNVTPSTSQQDITPSGSVDGYDEVVVAAVTSSIDQNIAAGNIKKDVVILGVTGSYEGGGSPTLQNKTVTPSTSQQTVQADQGYDGLDTVTVEAVDSSIDSNIQAGNIKSGIQILGVTGNYSGGGSNYEQKSVTPDFSSGDVTVSPDSGYDALSSVVIQKDSDLTPQNIKKDVNVFGIVGTAETGGVAINPHPTSLAYAGTGDTDSSSHSDILSNSTDWTKEVDLQNINLSNGLRYVFYNNTSVTNLDLRTWDFTNVEVTNVQNMFNGCSNLVTIQGTLRWNKIGTPSNTFAGCTSLVNLPVTNFGFGATTNSITLDLSSCSSLDADTMIQNMETNGSGKTRIIKLHSTVYANLAQATISAAASKNITLQSA